LTAQGAGEVEQQRVLGQCAPPVRGDQLRQSLGEDHASTASVATEETTHLDVQHHTSTSPREISERALIVAVDTV
jgi:hypothetical protein